MFDVTQKTVTTYTNSVLFFNPPHVSSEHAEKAHYRSRLWRTRWA